MVTGYLSSLVKEKSEEEIIQDRKAQEEIDILSPELKSIADTYKHLGAYHSLEQVKAQEEINNLPLEPKVVADKYLSHLNCPSNALEQAKARKRIQILSPERKEIADSFLWDWNPPTAALSYAMWKDAVSQHKKRIELFETLNKNKIIEKQLRTNPEEQAKAQEEIDMLPPELKAVADKYLARKGSPTSALENARAQEKINELSPEIKEIADSYLWHGNPPTVALSYAMGKGRGDE